MKKICFIVCTYNSQKYVVNCINSLLNQTSLNGDIVVVDNASTDDTVMILKENFKDNIIIISNKKNLGGSGGFDKGIQFGLDNEYEYLMLLDNDIVLSEKTVAHMESFLDKHDDTAIVGAKICFLDNPDRIQDFGSWLNFENYEIFVNKIDDGLDKECDYVPSCALMVKSDVVKKVGSFPINNFIYFDDIEFCWKIKLAGYKIYCLANTLCLHKNGEISNNTSSTFGRYYRQRNRLNFFSRYVDENQLDVFCEKILKEFYNLSFFCSLKNQSKLLMTYLYSFDDFLHGISGEADKDKIFLDVPDKNDRLSALVKDRNIFKIKLHCKNKDSYNDCIETLRNLFRVLSNSCVNIKKIKVFIPNLSNEKNIFIKMLSDDLCLYKLNEIKQYIEFSDSDYEDSDSSWLKFMTIDHISNVEKDISPIIYIDKYCNIVKDSDEYKKIISWNLNLDNLIRINKTFMKEKIMQIRKKLK